MTKPISKRKAYSYIRFSTPEQEMGTSLRRQLQDCEAFCRTEGLALDESHVDRGVSAFRRRNATAGALSVFLAKVRAGEIEVGSVLVVENLNRLTRAEPLDAFDLLREIIKAGIELVTLHDRQRYTSASMREIGQLIQALVIFAGSHQESVNKSNWTTSSWTIKRSEAVKKGLPMTRQVPAWLRVEGVRSVGNRQDWSGARFVAIEDRVKVLKEIFELRAEGWGRRRIATEINARGIQTWGRGKRRSKGGWQVSYIHKLLTSRAVLGEFQPYRLEAGRYSPRIKVGEPIANYYPAVIDVEIWEAAQAYNEKARSSRGRPSTVLLTGLLVDPNGAPMHVERKGDGCDYFATAYPFRRSGKTTWRWRIDHLDQSVLMLVRGIDWQRVLLDESRRPELQRLRSKLAVGERQEAALRAKIAKAAKAMLADLGAFGEEVKAQADALNAELASIRVQNAEFQAAISEIERTSAAASGSIAITKDLRGELTDERRIRLRTQLRSLVKRIQIWPDAQTSDPYRKTALEEATKQLKGNRGISARAAGKVAGALRFTFAGGKEITAYVTYRPAARADREPRVIGFSDPNGMSLDDWLEMAIHAGWGLADEGVQVEVED